MMIAALSAPPQERQPRAPQTDETVAVAKGARLTVDNFAGEVVIKAWDRDSLRVQARHGSRAKVNIRTTAAGVVISAQQAAPSSVDYEITAPAWMPIKVVGTYNFITVEGAQSEVSAETTRGDVVIRGGTAVTAKSIQGEVIVENARGRVIASSVNEGVRVSGTSGDVTVETTNGDISLTQMKSQNVEASTINGDIEFEGRAADRGRYTFTTHNGDITIAVPESSNVSFAVRTYQGRFSPALKVSGPPRAEVRQGRRTTYTLGNGSAEMEIETFGGSIRLIGPESFKPRTPSEKDKSKNHDFQ
jgi:DUF4097 and DUF4098 domain-containing protein YvlB